MRPPEHINAVLDELRRAGARDVVFPRDLSKDSVDDLAGYLNTFMKRARRYARPKGEEEGKDEAAN